MTNAEEARGKVRAIINNSTTKQQKYDGAALRPNVGNRPTEETRQRAKTATAGGISKMATARRRVKATTVCGVSESQNYYGTESRQGDLFAHRHTNPALYDIVLCKHSVQAGLPFVSSNH